MQLRQEIESRLMDVPHVTVGVSIFDLVTCREWAILPDRNFHAASTMKVCVLLELFHQVASGEVQLDQSINVKNEFTSIADGTSYTIDIVDDSYPELHGQIGGSATLLEIAIPMVTASSNLATNLLVEILGAARITQYMAELGASGLQVLRGVEDGPAFRRGLNNLVTATGLTTILRRLAEGKVVTPDASRQMVEILAQQTHKWGIPRGLPAGVQVANKTGWTGIICHDTGIVYPPNRNPYVITVLTEGFEDRKTAETFISDLSRCTYQTITHDEEFG